MRENIGLFRGKRIDNGEWVEGNLLTPNEVFDNWCISCVDCLSEYGDIGCLELEVDPDTIGECTGLKDKNGKLAFERDITEDALGRRWVIFGGKGGFRICRDTEWLSQNGDVRIVYEGLSDFQNGSWFEQNHTIIGNIHDNPELLKGGEG